MTLYYAGLAVPAALALLATMMLGFAETTRATHVAAGLVTSILVVAVHTLLILFMVVTGRVIKSAMRTRPLSPEFLPELNAFFATKRGFPVAVFAVLAIVSVAVLGYSHRGFGTPSSVHWGLGVVAVAFNLWAFRDSHATLGENQLLLDRLTNELDRLDAEREARGEPPPAVPDDNLLGPRARYLVFAAVAWIPYVYWTVLLGERTSSVFPILSAAVSASGLLAAWRAPGKRA
jgi:hypothetical protein